MLHGGLVVVQSILAVAFGAGLFIAFDQLWRWNNIVALVLSVLVILGLVAGVRVVRRTEDIGSTLTAVAVGALVTLGPLALLQSG
ncbi:putative membrane protein [Mycobacterium xenopi 3993]|nr:putative membrane protein [Mycobacterium xenopi 3993]